MTYQFHGATCSLAYDLTAPSLGDFVRGYPYGGMLCNNGAPPLVNPHAVAPDERGYLPVKKYWTTLRSYNKAVADNYTEIVPSALFSTVDAINSLERGSTTDVLQSLYKLPQYESMIPHIAEAIDLLSDICHRRLDGSTLKDIMALASATTLQGSFQWRPAIQLITTELPKIVALIAELQSYKARNLVVGRGKFNFELPPGSLGRPTAHLTTRSKIVLDISARSLVTAFLGYDGLGIWPKPSSIWDLIPFSFVANWFTNVGPSIKRAEYASLLLDVPAYFVHTYAITSPFVESELASWEMTSFASNPLSFRAYWRDVSHYSPLPRDSKFGFGLPQHLPPSGVIAALIYQLIF
jgi:hypothetical protein